MPSEFTVRADDGWVLRGAVDEPSSPPLATVVVAHAMMCSSRTFERGFTRALVDAGFRAVSFDFRGHGASGPRAHEGGDWSYDDLVRLDVPAIVAHARGSFGGPVALVGHSLGAHVTAAALGLGLTELDALVLVAGNVWLPRLDPSMSRRWKKRAVLTSVVAMARAAGRLPARRLGLGSDDEPLRYWRAFDRWWRDDAWTSDDGRDDYLAALSRASISALAITSDGDALNCAPTCGRAFADHLPRVEHHALEGRDAPDHMGLVTRRDLPAAAPTIAWLRALAVREDWTGRVGSLSSDPLSQLAQLLRFLERDDVSDVVLQTSKAPMARVGEGYHPLSKSPITTVQIEALLAGSPVAELLPRADGSSPVTRLMLFGRAYQVRAARRDGNVQIRFERAASPGSVGTAAAVRVAPEPEQAAPPPRVSPAPARQERPTTTAPAGELAAVLADARAKRASDVHVVADRPVQVRLAGQLRPTGQPLPANEVELMLRSLLTAEQEKRLEEVGYVDFGVELPGAGRLRANVSRQRSGWKGSFRLVMQPMPTLASLGLPPELAKVTTYHQGLVVIAGPNGHGKTTTLAAIVDVINSQKSHHVLTAEDPVEFVHPRKKALMSQREVGSHTRSFASALKASLREDPDVIVIGELRDRETVEIAITAAETGHLVIATMSTPNAAKTIDRLIDLFPPADQQQVRVTLAGALKFVVAQRLLPSAAGDDFVAAVELISGSPPLWAMIRDNKLYQLPNLVQRGRAFGMIRFDDSLAALVKEGKITEDAALAAADNKRELANVLRGAPAGAPAPVAPKPVAAPALAAGGKLGDLASKVGIGGLFGKKELAHARDRRAVRQTPRARRLRSPPVGRLPRDDPIQGRSRRPRSARARRERDREDALRDPHARAARAFRPRARSRFRLRLRDQGPISRQLHAKDDGHGRRLPHHPDQDPDARSAQRAPWRPQARRAARRARARDRPDRQRQVDDAGGDGRPHQLDATWAHPHDRGSRRVRAPVQDLPGHAPRGR